MLQRRTAFYGLPCRKSSRQIRKKPMRPRCRTPLRREASQKGFATFVVRFSFHVPTGVPIWRECALGGPLLASPSLLPPTYLIPFIYPPYHTVFMPIFVPANLKSPFPSSQLRFLSTGLQFSLSTNFKISLLQISNQFQLFPFYQFHATHFNLQIFPFQFPLSNFRFPISPPLSNFKFSLSNFRFPNFRVPIFRIPTDLRTPSEAELTQFPSFESM
jgi:hypothetical protein